VIFKYCKKSFPCVKNTNGILKYETLIYKEISYIHVDNRAMGILKIPHTAGVLFPAIHVRYGSNFVFKTKYLYFLVFATTPEGP
jgi:hypothetical protein